MMRGHFFYLVRIPVGIRLAPNIMSKRAGGGYKLHTVVEGSQRCTPPGSKITYVKLCNGKGWVFETTMDGQLVLERFAQKPLRKINRKFYRLLEDMRILSEPNLDNSSIIKMRSRNSIIECSEELTPFGSSIKFLKLRHDDGWAFDCSRDGKLMLKSIEGEAQVDEGSKFYKVLIAVAVRSAPDIDCARIPNILPKAVGTIVESVRRYTPPGDGGIVYVKLAHEHGWIFEQTTSNQQVLQPLCSSVDRQRGQFYYQALENLLVKSSPDETDNNCEIIGEIEKGSFISAELQFCPPHDPSVVHLRLVNEKGWITSKNHKKQQVIRSIREHIYKLYVSPPSWVAIGFPCRKWYAVPHCDEQPNILVEETMLQDIVFQKQNILASSSQGQNSVPISRNGVIFIPKKQKKIQVALEEIKHPSSAFLFSFPWKQVWWIFDFNEKVAPIELERRSMGSNSDKNNGKHAVELQHGLRGGHHAIYFDGKLVEKKRIMWDTGFTCEFKKDELLYRVKVTFDGHLFSSESQHYTYSLQVDGNNIEQLQK